MDYKIIDAHCHIFPDKIVEKATQHIGEFYNLEMSVLGSTKKLISSKGSADICKYIIFSCATTANQVDKINSFILEKVMENDAFYGLITLHQDMDKPSIDRAIKFALDNNLKGIKLHPDFQKFYIDSPQLYKIYERAEGVLPILFHTGDIRFEESRPFRLVNIAKKFKNLTCIAAHFGGYERWEETHLYIDVPNVYFDTCSSLFKLEKERALQIMEMLGSDRFMFGSDFPMWDIKEEIDRFLNLGLDIQTNQNIFYNNAVKIFNL